MSDAEPAVLGDLLQAIGPCRPRALHGAQACRALDAIAIGEYGIPGLRLMERAGEAAFAALSRRWPRRARMAVVCGPGNNGGDGYVVARLAAAAGWSVRCHTLVEPERSGGDAALALTAMRAAGVTPEPLERLRGADVEVVVDGLFGTGLTRALEGRAADAVRRINASRGPVVALDVPSGLDADTGAVLGPAVGAKLTVTFIADKPGLYTGAGPDRCGETWLADLDLPFRPVHRHPAAAWRLRWRDLEPLLGPRAPTAHKGSAGRAVLVGGDRGFAGAIRMAGEAAARTGAGLTSVATHPEHAGALLSARPELMSRPVSRAGDLAPVLAGASVIGVGPGLGTAAWGRDLLQCVLEQDRPLVLDADALNLLAQDLGYAGALRGGGRARVLTPHPGEAARLLQTSVGDVEGDRIGAAAMLADRFDATVVLKGHGTVIATPGLPSIIASGGHPAMASGGMGDVLTGVICALMAQGAGPAAAAVRGVLVHAQAAERAVRRRTLERGLLALELMPELQHCGRWL